MYHWRHSNVIHEARDELIGGETSSMFVWPGQCYNEYDKLLFVLYPPYCLASNVSMGKSTW